MLCKPYHARVPSLVLSLTIAIALLFGMGVRASGEPQRDAGSSLTVERIYDSQDFSSRGVNGRWLDDSSGYLTLKSNSQVGGRDIVLNPLDGDPHVVVSASELIPAGESTPLAIDDYAFSSAMDQLLIYTNSKRVWRRNTRGDYWILDRAARELRKLGGDGPEASMMFAKISPDGRRVAFVRDRDIYVEDLQNRIVQPLTAKPNNSIINGTFDWVYEEELGLRDGFRWSPDSKHIAYWQLDTTGVRDFPLVNNTQGLYPRIKWFKYPKVGQRNSASRIGVIAVGQVGAKTRWLDIPGDPREHYLARMEWCSDTELTIQQLNRRQNRNLVYIANTHSGSLKVALTETDDAWVNVHDEMHWIDDNQFTWVSERSGWRHVLLAQKKGGPVRPVTSGDFDVIRLVHADEKQVYFLASPKNATQRYLFRSDLTGGDAAQITPSSQSGSHNYQISPDGKFAIHSWSSLDRPSTTDLVSLPDHRRIRRLENNLTLKEKIAQLAKAPAEFFSVDIGNGVSLDAWCVKPPKMQPGKKYPLLVYVYGEPAGQTVLDRWGGSTYLWHLMLAQQGYVVMSFDNRGTPAAKGREWRKCVYKHVGVLAPEEQAAAVRAVLADRPYLDKDRVGVWGWSGGGSMSLNAIFKHPDLYHTAISIAPVPNQRYYDTIYQERYMGLPSDNVEGFRKGSPINYAHQLEGDLLLIHGTGDDNCHYQTTEMLINELIRHNKLFSMMAYPNRSHSIREGKNTTLHLRRTMTQFLNRTLPPGPR